MKPAYNSKSRRQFLLGSGGIALALPLLPSLLPKEAQAQAIPMDASRRFFVYATTAHGPFQSQFYGPLLTRTPTQTMQYAGFNIRSAPLSPSVQGDMTIISDCIRSRSTKLTPRMTSLMNVINGLDFYRDIGHNYGWGIGGDETNPTIDQVMAASRSFYPSPVSMPVIVRDRVSLMKSGTSVAHVVQSADSNVLLFNKLFGVNGTGPTAPEQTVLVDRVREHANLVLRDPQCSAQCRTRLTEYLDMLSELQTKLLAQTGTGGAVARPTADTSVLARSAGFFGDAARQGSCELLWNDVVVAAFAAGLSRVYVSAPTGYVFASESMDTWHGNYAHGLDDLSKRPTYNAAVQLHFETAILDIATKLDAVKTADGTSLLDRSLIANTHELGSGGSPGWHGSRCIPLLTIGNAGGFFRTGLSLDYRDQTLAGGLLYNQWTAMVLRSMGVPASEYSVNNGMWGYPSVRRTGNFRTDAVWNVASQDLPWLKA